MSDQENLQTLLDFLAETPNKLTYFGGLPTTETRWKGSEAEFSVVENFCHLRDLEVQGYALRIRRILAEIDPVLADFDGARVAAESDYNHERVDLALAAFATARRDNVRMLRSLTEEQLNRQGTLEGVGRITLEQLAEKMREHDEGHLDDLRVLRQQLELGRSREVSQE